MDLFKKWGCFLPLMEEWKCIEEYPKYRVSNYGRVWGLHRNKLISPALTGKGYKKGSGYLGFHLYNTENNKQGKVHREVAKAFIKNPEDKPQVNHIDENTTNNCLYNLNWSTNLENQRHGLVIERRRESLSRKVNQYTLDGEFIREWVSTKEVQRVLGIWSAGVSRCCRGLIAYSGGYTWRYPDVT